jgi:Na+/citrate or Na+/malate symporter
VQYDNAHTGKSIPFIAPATSVFLGSECLNVNPGISIVTRHAFFCDRQWLSAGSASPLLAGIGVAKTDVQERIVMYQDAIVLLLIAVTVPVGAIVTFCGLAKKKRHRRPLQNFR